MSLSSFLAGKSMQHHLVSLLNTSFCSQCINGALVLGASLIDLIVELFGIIVLGLEVAAVVGKASLPLKTELFCVAVAARVVAPCSSVIAATIVAGALVGTKVVFGVEVEAVVRIKVEALVSGIKGETVMGIRVEAVVGIRVETAPEVEVETFVMGIEVEALVLGIEVEAVVEVEVEATVRVEVEPVVLGIGVVSITAGEFLLGAFGVLL